MPAMQVASRLPRIGVRTLETHTTLWLERGVLSVLVVAAALWLWTWVSERRSLSPAPRIRPDYAAHFGLTDMQLRHYRDSQTCVVHHDASGEIIGIDAVSPPPAAPAAMPVVAPVILPVEPAYMLPDIAEAA